MKIVITALLLSLLVIGGIGHFLSPDDLHGCEISPDEVCRTADAIVAVSGGDTNARTDTAIRLYKNGWAPVIIFSGAAADKTGPSNAEVMRDRAIGSGVPEESIVIEAYSETTRQNAENTQELFTRLGIDNVILVTSPYHQRRASLEFKSRSSGDVLVRSHPARTDSQWDGWWWITPRGWYLTTSELAKVALFYLGGTR